MIEFVWLSRLSGSVGVSDDMSWLTSMYVGELNGHE